MDTDQLKDIPVFASLDDETLNAVAAFATETSVRAGKHLVKEGDYAYEFMAIVDGEADVIRGGEYVATLGAGEFFGEMALLEKTLRTASVVAKTPMRLVTLSHWDLKRVGSAMSQIRETLDERKRSNQQVPRR
ncbi:MAG: family transcriptional regulator, cyclic receptor protein [Solirubrobacteraceae bacterium]|jgi:cAMP-dependent protein kinase regulator|nr:family transcriptional regulator, cyclic receptor protein [Solirubrobacteraceae bacterium]MEA2187252.1 family transcriptional regulator, cyclic receptor protein [Solirubrobacteraceae bacterium]MEA2234219.1 family transcriptional regulator, cyclic receptor protein [Solirubrobacteraceae bacterium]